MLHRYVFAPLASNKALFIAVVVLTLLALAVGSTFVFRAFRESPLHLLPERASGRLALAAVVVLGLGLRLSLAPSVPIHCNAHGIREVRTYLYGTSDDHVEANYEKIFPHKERWLLGFIGAKEKNVFLINKILGTFAILSIFMFAKGITGSDLAG
jgi:hypothetical protein